MLDNREPGSPTAKKDLVPEIDRESAGQRRLDGIGRREDTVRECLCPTGSSITRG